MEEEQSHEIFRAATQWEEDLIQYFSLEELARAIRKIKATSAPGMDGIDYMIIRHLPDAYLEELRKILNTFFREGTGPEDWTQYKIIFIDKPGKDKV